MERPKPLPLQERMQMKQNITRMPMVCEHCNGTFFMDAHAQQYSNFGYGSVTFTPLSVTPIPIKVCLCGEVYTLKPTAGKMAPGNTPEFQEAFALAKSYRAKQTLDALLEAVPSRNEFRKLLERVDALFDPKSEPEPEPPPPPPVESAVAKVDPHEVVAPAPPAEEPLGEQMKRRSGRQKPKPRE